jgi:hypothetical protein
VKTEFIEMLRKRLAEYPDEWVFRSNLARLSGHGYKLRLLEVMDEVDAIVAENAALKAKPAPARRVREVMFSDGFVHRWNNGVLEHRGRCLLDWHRTESIATADIETAAALKSDPYEPVETLEAVIRKSWQECPIKEDVYEYVANAARAWFATNETPEAA